MSYCKGSSNVSLYDLFVDVLVDGSIQIPAWQRGDIWSKKKQKEFGKIIRQKIAKGGVQILTGVVVIYETKDDPGIRKISDGLQRTYNGKRIFEQLSLEIGIEKAKACLKNIKVVVEDMEYDDEAEAKLEFILLNSGTSLTAYEQCQTIVTDLTPRQQWIDKVFDPLNNVMNGSVAKLDIKASNTRIKNHKHRRDNMALFLRFANGDKDISDYKSGSSVTEEHFTTKKTYDSLLETRFRNLCESEGIDKIADKVEEFRKFIERETALYKVVWEEIDKSEWKNPELKEVPTETNYRWCMAVAILRRNREIERPKYRKFISKFLTHTQGGTAVGASRSSAAVSLSNLTPIRRAQSAIEYKMDESIGDPKSRRRGSAKQVKAGHHKAHKQSFAHYGDGSVMSKTAIDNLSQGTMDMKSFMDSTKTT